MKKQIWLRPDQIEVVIDALDVYQSKVIPPSRKINRGLNDTVEVACRFTGRRIKEVRALFADEIPKP